MLRITQQYFRTVLIIFSATIAFASREPILVVSGLGIPPLSSCLVYRFLLDQPACQVCMLIKEK